MKSLVIALPLAAAVSGCAYFNGLYNANRLAAEAERAEREGRPAEARSLWVQAAVKAESVVVRYPESGYRDDALLMQGRALSRSGACLDARSPLERAVATSPEDAIWTDAGLLLAECLLELGNADSARTILLPFVHHWDSSVVYRALWLRGRAALVLGDASSAIQDLSRTPIPDATLDYAAALVAAGRVGEAAARLDSARRRSFDEHQWAVILHAVGGANPEIASTIVDSLVENDALTAGQRARLFLDDAERWHERDPARREARLARALAAAGDSVESRIARARLLESRLHSADAADSLPEIVEQLERLATEGGQVAADTRKLRRILSRGVPAVKGSGRMDPQLFRFAEEVRDSLALPRLAARLFLEVANRYPRSPFAPKALLAAAGTWEGDRERALRRLRTEYGNSPYARAAAGLAAPGFEALEDSLRAILGQPGASSSAAEPPVRPRPIIPDTNQVGGARPVR